jgi:hypothetical protein
MNYDSFAVLLYLDDADVSKRMFAGHLRAPQRTLVEPFAVSDVLGKITEPVDESQAVPGRGGGAIFMHGLTPDASNTNTSTHARRALILRHHAADAFPIYLDR